MTPPWILPAPREDLRGEEMNPLSPPGDEDGPRSELAHTIMEGREWWAGEGHCVKAIQGHFTRCF